jgi:DNA invertase Pin-like site-specific DNA recombinase
MMKVAIYIRVSKKDMHPENQRLELERHAEKEEWEYTTYEEKESTRKTRPIKEGLMQKLRRKEYDCLLVWKLDRWGRSMQELALNLEELKSRNIRFISLRDGLDLNEQSATARLQFHLLSAFAEFERGIIRERTMAGLERAKSQGKKLGRPKGSKDKKRRRIMGYRNRSNNTPL